jgi:hypothetical protein
VPLLAELAPEAGDGTAVSDELGECRRHGILVDDCFAAGDRPLEEEAWRGVELPAAAGADQDGTGWQDMGDTPALGGEWRDGALVGGNDLVTRRSSRHLAARAGVWIRDNFLSVVRIVWIRAADRDD